MNRIGQTANEGSLFFSFLVYIGHPEEKFREVIIPLLNVARGGGVGWGELEEKYAYIDK